jgi:hypothetical protein
LKKAAEHVEPLVLGAAGGCRILHTLFGRCRGMVLVHSAGMSI